MEDETTPGLIERTTADENGQWTSNAIEELGSGQHRIEVSDDQGNRDESIIYVDRQMEAVPGETEVQIVESTEFVDRVTDIIHPAFAWAILLFLIIILILSVNMSRLGRKADKLSVKQEKRKHHLRNALIVSVAAIIAALILGFLVNKQTGLFDRTIRDYAQGDRKPADVNGIVVAPFGEPVSGVDLVAGQTSIRTTDSGRFAFRSIDPEEGLRVTHPSLRRALRFRVEDEQLFRLIFDPELYNIVIQAADLEARERFSELKPLMHSAIRETAYVNELQDNRQTIFTGEDVSDQELFIVSTKTYPAWNSKVFNRVFAKGVEVTVSDHGKALTYYLALDGGDWRLIQ